MQTEHGIPEMTIRVVCEAEIRTGDTNLLLGQLLVAIATLRLLVNTRHGVDPFKASTIDVEAPS